MDNAEGIEGPRGDEYIKLMCSIITECSGRIRNLSTRACEFCEAGIGVMHVTNVGEIVGDCTKRD